MFNLFFLPLHKKQKTIYNNIDCCSVSSIDLCKPFMNVRQDIAISAAKSQIILNGILIHDINQSNLDNFYLLVFKHDPSFLFTVRMITQFLPEVKLLPKLISR